MTEHVISEATSSQRVPSVPKPAGSVSEFLRRPAGTYVFGRNFLYVCQAEDVFAVYGWGRPDLDDVRSFLKVRTAEVRPAARPHLLFVDLQGMIGIESDAFAAFRDFAETIKSRQAAVTVKKAIVRPGGLAGTVIAGFQTLYPQPYPTRIFTTAEEALAWLGLKAQIHENWESVLCEVRDISHDLVQLRRVIETQLSQASLEEVARRLGVSGRTLQRRLRAGGTTFQRELDRVRLSIAEPLITETDEKLEVVARQVGFSSYQHFSTWFHQHTGRTAKALRRTASPDRARSPQHVPPSRPPS